MKYCATCQSTYPPEYHTCPRDQAPLRHTAELVPGLVLRGKYEILEKIGQGGMASVYRARHLAFGEVRAIKVVSPLLAGDEEFQKRFRTEAVVTRRLQHPNAVRVDDLDVTEDGRPFIVMEYVEGRSLRDVIRNESPLPVRRAASLARQVAAALGAAHALGIVHRDIKPDNVLVTRDADGGEHAKVLDFGIAKAREGTLAAGAEYTPTQTGMVVGTPQYMSPEQAMGKRGDELDGRADLYSLGVIVWEMVTGRLPFQSDTPMGLILQHLQTPAPVLQQAHPELRLPGALATFLATALAKDRTRRFRDARAMEDALLALAEGQDTLVSVPGTLPPRRGEPDVPTATRLERGGTRVLAAGNAARGTRERPPAPRPEIPEEPRASSTPALLASGAVILLVVGAIAWQLARPRPQPLASPTETTVAEAPAPPEAPPNDNAIQRESDARLQNEIQRLLLSSAALRGDAIVAEAANGIVTLGGSARNATSAQLAVSLASSVPGARRVFDTIQIAEAAAALSAAPGPRPSEDRVAASDTRSPLPDAGPADGNAAAAGLIEKGQRALASGDAQSALQACQAALQLEPRLRIAQACVLKAQGALRGGPGPRRR